jgi:hypothetical protein
VRTTCGQRSARLQHRQQYDGKVGNLKPISEKGNQEGTSSDLGVEQERTGSTTLNTARARWLRFEVSEGATAIKFTLKIDGRDMTEWVLIARRANPGEMTFTLPAHNCLEEEEQ